MPRRLLPHRAIASTSRDFLARVPRHLMVARAGDLGWSDWGTPEAIERTLAALHVVPPWRAPLAATA